MPPKAKNLFLYLRVNRLNLQTPKFLLFFLTLNKGDRNIASHP